MGVMTESTVESAALAWLESLGWQVRHGAEIAPGELLAERQDHGQVILEQRLRDALTRLNPDLPPEALGDAFRKLTRLEGADLVQRNRALHRLLIEGIPVEYPHPGLTATPLPLGEGKRVRGCAGGESPGSLVLRIRAQTTGSRCTSALSRSTATHDGRMSSCL